MPNSLRSGATLLLCCTLLFQSHALDNQAQATTPQTCLQPRSSIKTSAWLTGIYFSPDGRLVTQRGRQRLKVWDALTGQLYREYLGNHDRISTVAFNRDGARLAAGDQGGFAWVWDVATGRLVAKLDTKHHAGVQQLAISPDGKLLATHGEGACYWTITCNTKAKLWNIDEGTLKATLTLPDLDEALFSRLAFSPDGRTLAGILDSKGGLWDSQTGALRAKLIGSSDDARKYETWGYHTPWELIFSADGRLLLTLSFTKLGGSVDLWDGVTGEWQATLDKWISSMTLSPDEKLLAVGGAQVVKVFDLNTRKQVRTFARGAGPVRSVSFSPDGRLLAGSDGSDTYVWEMASGQLRQKLPKATQATFSPDGHMLATVYEAELTLWNVSYHQP